MILNESILTQAINVLCVMRIGKVTDKPCSVAAWPLFRMGML